ncbi:MAG: UpxY family transcription antiterminator [Phaeodactylibacter sp.]|nr:UpxY family transcription antiterminator [Phaeodactylibacter sp.]MCB9276544.1 UpxY family transcription antiterminator [Lewinellaceae bacterium]
MKAAPQEVKDYEDHLHPQEARWFAVYTRYKREKMVAARLREKGIECYLPLQQLTRRYTRKVKVVELPLISCYIFARINRQEYVPVLETPDVVQFVRFRRNLIAIPEAEIDILRRVVGEGMEVQAEPRQFRPGDEVEIIGGQLTGLKGVLLEQRSDKNFLIELENLGYSLLMQIDPALLHRIAPSPGRSGAQHVGEFRKYL